MPRLDVRNLSDFHSGGTIHAKFFQYQHKLFYPHSLTDTQVDSAVLSAPELDGEYRHGRCINEVGVNNLADNVT